MSSYPIIDNCNFRDRDDRIGMAINDAVEAVHRGYTDDAALVAALDNLEAVLHEHADGEDERSVRLCEAAEQQVDEAWTEELRDAVLQTRIARYSSW